MTLMPSPYLRLTFALPSLPERRNSEGTEKLKRSQIGDNPKVLKKGIIMAHTGCKAMIPAVGVNVVGEIGQGTCHSVP